MQGGTMVTFALRADGIEGVRWGGPGVRWGGAPSDPEGDPVGDDGLHVAVNWPHPWLPRPGDEVTGFSLNKGRVWVDRVEWSVKGAAILHCWVRP
jgi:hypothetical protein